MPTAGMLTFQEEIKPHICVTPSKHTHIGVIRLPPKSLKYDPFPSQNWTHTPVFIIPSRPPGDICHTTQHISMTGMEGYTSPTILLKVENTYYNNQSKCIFSHYKNSFRISLLQPETWFLKVCYSEEISLPSSIHCRSLIILN